MGHKDKIFPTTDTGVALEQVAQRDYGIFILGETQNSPRQGPEQPDLSLRLALLCLQDLMTLRAFWQPELFCGFMCKNYFLIQYETGRNSNSYH